MSTAAHPPRLLSRDDLSSCVTSDYPISASSPTGAPAKNCSSFHGRPALPNILQPCSSCDGVQKRLRPTAIPWSIFFWITGPHSLPLAHMLDMTSSLHTLFLLCMTNACIFSQILSPESPDLPGLRAPEQVKDSRVYAHLRSQTLVVTCSIDSSRLPHRPPASIYCVRL